MKNKAFILLVILSVLFCTCSFADTADFSSMTDEELRAQRDEINLELALRNQSGTPIASWDMDAGHIDLIEVRRGTDKSGEPGVSFTFTYTNTTNEIKSISSTYRPECYQSGIQLEDAVVNKSYTETVSVKTQPGATVTGCMYGFSLIDDTKTVDLRFPRSFNDTGTDNFITVEIPD